MNVTHEYEKQHIVKSHWSVCVCSSRSSFNRPHAGAVVDMEEVVVEGGGHLIDSMLLLD